MWRQSSAARLRIEAGGVWRFRAARSRGAQALEQRFQAEAGALFGDGTGLAGAAGLGRLLPQLLGALLAVLKMTELKVVHGLP
ncbi:hypothetical protein ACI3L1_05580 [Deinococcus sp. SM5_A1]|uniref:hypothetical protein n=1 Tax=Deinococcus sp. SM5_A1 TaxID=3379094 RepID=UPI00385D7ED4